MRYIIVENQGNQGKVIEKTLSAKTGRTWNSDLPLRRGTIAHRDPSFLENDKMSDSRGFS